MRIDLNCPAEVVGSELNQPDRGWIQLMLMDLTDRGIDSCEATVRLLDRSGEELGRTVHRARALHGRAHSVFPMSVPMEIPEAALRAEAVLDKVWFEDHDVWRRNPDSEVEYESNLLPPGNDLNALKYVAGAGAAGFPSQQAEVWVCVCGRANANQDAVCLRCRRQKTMIFQHFSRQAVLRQVSQRERQLDLQTRGAREETAQLQRLREAEYDQRMARRGRRRKLLAALLAAALLAAGCFFGAEPALRLWSAETALRADRLEDAREILTGLRGFPGAETRLQEAEIRIARRDGEEAAEDEAGFSAERMEEIAARLRNNGDGESDVRLAGRVDLSRARALLSGGREEEAELLLKELPEGLAGREELLRDCTYARAQAAMAGKRYDEARRLFLGLGDYPGAEDGAKEALYEPALAWMEAGEYDAAIEALNQIPEYQDSRSLIRQCWYLKGYVLQEAGEAEAARQAYLKAEDYEDAAQRAREIRWNQAEAFLAAEDYESALPLYRELDGFEDARTKWIQCATAMARASYRQREYIQAAAWLEDLPEETRDTRQIRTRAYYLGAKAAADRGELEKAVELMERVPDYSDAQRNIRTWRMALAQGKMDEGMYEEAREILLPVQENYNVQRMLREIEKYLTPAEEESGASQ